MRGLKPSEAEFTELVAAKAHALRRTAYLMCGDWHLAEDHVQTSFVKVYKVWNRVRHREGLDGYLRTTLLRTCIDYKKKNSREMPSPEIPDYAVVPEGAVGDREILVASLRRISAGQRAVLVLRFFEDLSVEETAGVLGITAGTVKSQTAKGLEAMRGRVLADFAAPGADEPHWSPNAAALVRAADREIQRRRVLTVVGSFVAAGAVALGSIAVFGRSAPQRAPVQPVPTTVESSTKAADVLKYFRFDIGSEWMPDSPYPPATGTQPADPGLYSDQVSTAEAGTLLAIAGRLDPRHAHLSEAAGSGTPMKIGDTWKAPGRLYVKAVGIWSPQSPATQFNDTRPLGVVAVSMAQAPASGKADPAIAGAPCGVNIGMLGITIGLGGVQVPSMDWSACTTQQTLPDGSVVKTAKATVGKGTAYAAVREFPDHGLIGVVSTDFAVYDSGGTHPNSWQYVEHDGSSHIGPTMSTPPADATALAAALSDAGVVEFK